jgi:hypothetical protein
MDRSGQCHSSAGGPFSRLPIFWFGFPSENLTTPFSIDNLWRRPAASVPQQYLSVSRVLEASKGPPPL